MYQSTFQNVIFHGRPITDLKFNTDGDLIFASSKDGSVSMMNLQGRVVGSFEGSEGSINSICPLESHLITGSSAMTLSKWDIFTGLRLENKETEGVVRSIYENDQKCFFSTDNSMNMKSALFVYDKSGSIIPIFKPKRAISRLFSAQNFVIFGDENGFINKIDIRTNKLIMEAEVHYNKITCVKPSFCNSYFATSSIDSTVRLIDSNTFALKKKFECEDPVNGVAIFPTNDKVATVGGVTARDVTTTRGKSSFDTNFFDIVTSKKIGFFSTHFGTINNIDIHPLGKIYASSGEDGIVSIVTPGKDFYRAGFTNFN